MSGESGEIVGRLSEAFNSGDIERILSLIDPEFEVSVPPEFSPEPDTYRGHDGIRPYLDSFYEAMDDIRFQLEILRDAGPSVVASLRLTAKGRTTGIAVEQRVVQVWTVRAGKALRVENYPSLPEALQAVGLER